MILVYLNSIYLTEIIARSKDPLSIGDHAMQRRTYVELY